MYFNFILFQILLDIQIVFSKLSGINYFVNKRKVKSYDIEIINNIEANITWLEYRYTFENENTPASKATASELVLNKDCYNAFSSYTDQLLTTLNEFSEFSNVNDSSNEHESVIIECYEPNNKQTRKLLAQNYFLYQSFKSRYAIIYKKENKHKDIFVLTFVGLLWFCFLVVLFCLALCLHLATLNYSLIYKGCRTWSWVEITLWAIAAACQQGFSYTPTRTASRIVFLLGYLTSYVLYTAFTAAITSVLVQQETEPISLKSNKIFTYGFYNSNDIDNRNIRHEMKEFEPFLNKIDRTNIGIAPAVLLENRIMAKKFNQSDFNIILLEKKHGEYIVNIWITKVYRSNYKTLTTLKQSGIVHVLKYKPLFALNSQNLNQGYSSASLAHVKSALVLLLSGYGASLIVLFIELVIFGYHYRHHI